MWRIGIILNTCMFNIFIYVLCKDRNVDKVNEFFEKMEEEGFVFDIVIYNILIGSYCRKCRLDDVFYLYKIMYRRGVMFDIFIYILLINGFCKIGKVKEVRQVFCRLIYRGFVLDIVVYNFFIYGYCREGRMKEFRFLVYEMIGNGMNFDNFICRVFVEGYGRLGRWYLCLNMILEFKRFGVFIFSDIFKYLIVFLFQENRLFVVVKFLNRMLEDCYEFDEEIYDKLIKSFCDNDYLEEVLLYKRDMIERCINLCLGIY